MKYLVLFFTFFSGPILLSYFILGKEALSNPINFLIASAVGVLFTALIVFAEKRIKSNKKNVEKDNFIKQIFDLIMAPIIFVVSFFAEGQRKQAVLLVFLFIFPFWIIALFKILKSRKKRNQDLENS